MSNTKTLIIIAQAILIAGLALWLNIEISGKEYKTTRTTDSTRESDTTVTRIDTTITTPADSAQVDTVYKDTTVENEKGEEFTTKENNPFSYIRNYKTTVTDTLLSGVIHTTVQGYLVTQRLEYTPNYPIRIEINTETRVTERIEKVLRPKQRPFLGVSAIATPDRFGYEVSGGWQFSNGNTIQMGYSPSHDMYRIGITYNLRNLFK
jgi:hypothetical protein